MTKVVLTKTSDSYLGAIEVLNPIKEAVVRKLSTKKRLIIKINFVSALTQLPTTPFEAVKGFVDFVRNFYKGKIIIAEEATIGMTKIGFHRFGFKTLSKSDPRLFLLNSAKDKSQKITINCANGSLNLALAESYTNKENFIASICRAKTHDTVGVTLGIKNLLVGAIQQKPFARRSQIHQGKEIHQILAKLTSYTFPDLVLIDGVIGMQGNGPVYGKPIKSNWMLASTDALAADSLATSLMGFDIKDIGYLNLIAQKKLGRLYPKDQIKIIGPDPKTLIMPYQPHQTFDQQKQWR